MLRKLSVGVATAALLGMGSLPALAAPASHHPKVHHFGIPGATGVSAWGSYYKTSSYVRVTLCVEDTSSKVLAAAAGGIAVSKDSNRVSTFDVMSAKDGETDCSTLTTSDTYALVVVALSADENGNINGGQPKVLYGNIGIASGGRVSGGSLARLRVLLRLAATHPKARD